MDMRSACAEILHEVDGSLGCIVIDMETGLTVAAECRPGRAMNPTTINLVSVVSTNLFCGKLIGQFEAALGRPKGSNPGYVREVQMTTENANQFMAAIPGWDRGLFVLVTDKNVSLGLGWMAVHRAVERIGKAPRPSPSPSEAPEWPAPASMEVAARREAYSSGSPAPAPQPERGEYPAGRTIPHRAPPAAEAKRSRFYRHAADEAPPAEAPIKAVAEEAAPAPASAASEEQEKPPKEVVLGPRAKMFASRRRKGRKSN